LCSGHGSVRDRAHRNAEEAPEAAGPEGHTESTAVAGQLLEGVSAGHPVNFRDGAVPVRQVYLRQRDDQLTVRGHVPPARMPVRHHELREIL